MKRNIDLTENGMFSFSHFNDNDDRITNILLQIVNEYFKFPWNSFNRYTDNYFGHQRESLILLGNKVDRAEIRGYREMDSPNYCDRCGIRMNLHPWDEEVGVCRKCEEILERETHDKCLWRIKETIKNAVIMIGCI